MQHVAVLDGIGVHGGLHMAALLQMIHVTVMSHGKPKADMLIS